MSLVFSNNANTILAADIADAVVTAMTVEAGGAAKFQTLVGDDSERVTLTDGVNYEVVEITGWAGEVATIVRGVEGTAQAWLTGSIVEARITAGILAALSTHPAAHTPWQRIVDAYTALAKDRLMVIPLIPSTLLHFDIDFTNDGSEADVFTAMGAAVVSAANPKFGAGCLHIPVASVNNYITAPLNSALDPGAGDFTLDFHTDPTTLPGGDGVFLYLNGGNGITITHGDNQGGLALSIGYNSGSFWTPVVANPLYSTAYQHYALVRFGDVLTLYKDGTSIATTTLPAGAVIDAGSGATIIGRFMDGHIDEWRYTKGKALWETDFTPPTAAASIGATIDMPATPTLGDEVELFDSDGVWDTANVTVDGNGNNVMGSPTYVLSTLNQTAKAIFNGTEWRIR